jgi:hypothetical protein
MILPHERTRAVIQTREFLLELSVNLQLPEKIRSEPMFWPSQTFEIETSESQDEQRNGSIRSV